jgi:D-beta-D-heptose 7-phosphate kinase/D-beta-D-heptose 1-phosphate adenosyltransferase
MRMKRIEFAPILTLEEFVEIRGGLEGSLVLTSGGFDPIHPGHISCIVDSKTHGDVLVVVVNGDWFLNHKKGRRFMSLETRCEIVCAQPGVDYVVAFEVENDITVNQALEAIKPDVFTKGGDRADKTTIPEWETCVANGIEVVIGVGDSKVHSSSNILEDWYYHRLHLFPETTA